MSKKKTQEEFEQEVFDLVGEEYIVLGEYINSNTKIKMKHNICGYEYEVRPSGFLSGNRCLKCSGNMKKTTEIFKNEVYSLVGDEYTVVGEYKNTDTKIKMKHNVCNTYYIVRPYEFLGGCRCPKCANNTKKTTEEFKKEVYDLVGNEYTVLGEYKSNKIKIKMRHNMCGCEYESVPYSFLMGHRCPKCGIDLATIKNKKTQEQFERDVFDLVGNEYTVIGEYERAITKIKMRHNICGYEYKVKPNSFLSGIRCPRCCESKGEKAIYDFFEKKGVTFKREYKIPECKNIKPLPFDFAIFDGEGNIKLLIEYQGEQHYKKFDYFFKEDADFVNRVILDCKKRAYCEYNNIPLLEISYTDYNNIESILIDALGLEN